MTDIEHIKRLYTTLDDLIEAVEGAGGQYDLRGAGAIVDALSEAHQVQLEHQDWLLMRPVGSI